MADDLGDQIEDAAAEPRSVSVDGVTVNQQSVTDQIAADKYLLNRRWHNDPRRALRFVKFRPPGA